MLNSFDPHQDDILSVLIWMESVEILIAFLKETYGKKIFCKKSADKKASKITQHVCWGPGLSRS